MNALQRPILQCLKVCWAEAWAGAWGCCYASRQQSTPVLLDPRPCFVHITADHKTIIRGAASVLLQRETAKAVRCIVIRQILAYGAIRPAGRVAVRHAGNRRDSCSLDMAGRPQALSNGCSARPGLLHHIGGIRPLPPHARLRSMTFVCLSTVSRET